MMFSSTSFSQPLAIFDIDGTFFRSSLAVELISELVNHNIFPEAARNELDADFSNWLNRRGSYEAFITSLVEVYFKYIKGCREDDVKRISKSLVSYHKERVYRFTRDLMIDLKRQGYFLLALSGSPSEVVGEFRKYWPFDHAIGSVFEVVDGVYTGRPLREIAKNKKLFLQEFLKDFNLSLKGSYGVGDTESDVGFLEEVEHPIVFNPNASLKEIAEKRNWRVVVERKDVIYSIVH